MQKTNSKDLKDQVTWDENVIVSELCKSYESNHSAKRYVPIPDSE